MAKVDQRNISPRRRRRRRERRRKRKREKDHLETFMENEVVAVLQRSSEQRISKRKMLAVS